MKRTRVLAYLFLLALLLSGMLSAGRAAEELGVAVKVSPETAAIGGEAVVTVSLTGYTAESVGIRGLMVDINGLDTGNLTVKEYATLIEDSAALSNTASYNTNEGRVRLLYALLNGTLDASCQNVLRMTVQIDPDLTGEGSITLPIEVQIELENGQRRTLQSSCTIRYAPAEPSITLRSGTLNLLDKVCIIYYCSDDQITTNDADVAERGVLLFESAELAATKNPDLAYETIELVYDETQGLYAGQSKGIDARDMDKSQFAVAYVKMTDGTYYFSTKNGEEQIIEYSPLIYCRNKMNDPTVGELCRAMMHYGAAAQVAQYGMTTGLMNEGFAAVEYDAEVLGTSVFSVNTAVVNGLRVRSATMDLKGAISYIVEFTPSGDAVGKELYAEYNLLGKTESVKLETSTTAGRLSATISGVPAKDLGATLKVKAYYLGENDEKVYGGELVYSGYEYIRRAQTNANFSQSVKDLAKAMAMYVHYADLYGN